MGVVGMVNRWERGADKKWGETTKRKSSERQRYFNVASITTA